MEMRIRRPDDWHLHLRDGVELESVVAHTAERFARAVVMPNLQPPITTVAAALAYRERILSALSPDSAFEPLMTLYLTDETSTDEVRRAADSPFLIGAKLYPAGATTHSDRGVTDLRKLDRVLDAMQSADLPLLVHGEVTDPAVDVFDREAVFVERELQPIAARFPALRIVLEHVTTEEGVHFVRDSRAGIAGTLTVQHLLWNRNALFTGGIRPHHYCLPVLKRERHRRALVAAATSGNPRFFGGTDSAPHARGGKEASCGCAGIYTAHAAVEFYAEIFEAEGSLERLEGFLSHHGADFYRRPRNNGTILLRREERRIPESFPFGSDVLIPMRAGGLVSWTLVPEVA